ncbi:MAG: endonuclease MutS2 [Bacteroidota bacterium]
MNSRPPLVPSHLPSVLKKLEFDNVVERISRLSASDTGKERSLGIVPSIDREWIEHELRRVSECKELLIAEGSVPLDEMKSVERALHKTTVENQILSIQELLDVASTLRASRTMHAFLSKRKSTYKALADFIPQLFADRIVEFNISQALDPKGFVKDTASKELKQIRQDLISAGDMLRKRLGSILRAVSEQEVLQEEIITTRDGRLVIPVKAEYKNRVPGFIHSSSSSGATVYIEPAESLELNNALRELQLKEQREIHRVLTDLTRQVAEIRDLLVVALDALTTLDVLFAKARYSIEIIGIPPVLAPDPAIRIVQARHPGLLQRHPRDEVVPLSLELGGEAKTLVITGPNAGGKTVAMKTVGLLCLCAQAGIHIPCASESAVYPFRRIFVDIGDDQSIENDLSTFSSHLLNVTEILAHSDRESLVLVDEIGAGTDPAEGGALAATVLDELTRRGVTTIATTHHGSLKVFAHETPGVVNGSMEFDQASLKPTYRFKAGVPGSSFAFELAERIGIDRSVLSKARVRLGGEKTKLESLIVELEKQSQLYAQQQKEATEEKYRLESLIRSYEQKMTELKRELGTIRKKAVDEARTLVRDAQSRIEQSVKDIRESTGNKEVIRTARQAIRQLSGRLAEDTHQVPAETEDAREGPIAAGDRVRLREGRESGEVLEIQGQSAMVLWGNARLRVPVRDLVHGGREDTVPQAASSSNYSPEAKTEIDLRGLLGEEAIAQVEYFLDNALVVGLHRVDIIHGKGTGALRKKVTEFLKSHPHVKSFHLGEWNEGGTGVTVVELS